MEPTTTFDTPNLTSNDLIGRVTIPAIVTKQGSRITFQLNLMFRQITNLLDHTDVKPKDENDDSIDLDTLRNRYLRPEKVEDIVKYVTDNNDSYILPPISAIADQAFSFQPYNHQEVINRMGEEYDLTRNPDLIEEVLEEFDGFLQGFIIFKESDFEVEILDGNHRVAAIHKLTTKGKEFKSLRIGVQIFVENDIEKIRQAFVDMNTSTPIDKTIITLFSSRDALSLAAKETIGSNPEFRINEFTKNSPDYIGFDAINDSITRKSNAVLTLNMVKNMIVKFALGPSGTPKKFNSIYEKKDQKYYDLIKDFSTYFRSIFSFLPPFEKIKRVGPTEIPELRETYISLTGAGLYIIATLGYFAHKNYKDLESVALSLSELKWERFVEPGETNPLFRSGILSDTGKISNNRNSIEATIEAIGKQLYLPVK
jgi:DGQHR domain-containing protein